MKRSLAVRSAVWGAVTLAAVGCAQVAGLTEDYRRANAGGAAGAGGNVSASGGAAGEGEPSGGDAGSGRGGSTAVGGTAGSGAASGKGGAGGASTGGSSAGGSSNGGSSGSGTGGGGLAGAGGGSALGPVRIGFSEFHDSASGGDNASSHLTDATFAKPAGTKQGDFILVFFGSDHSLMNLSGTDLSQTGWTLLDQHGEVGTDGQGTFLLYKFAGASEPDPIVFPAINSAGSGDGVQGLLSVYRGVNAGAPINAYEVTLVTTGDTNVTKVVTPTPAVTTTAANCLLIAGLSPDSYIDLPEITAWPQGFVENQVSVVNPPHPYPYGWANIYSAERHLAAAGVVPASSFTWKINNGTSYFGALSFVLALAP